MEFPGKQGDGLPVQIPVVQDQLGNKMEIMADHWEEHEDLFYIE